MNIRSGVVWILLGAGTIFDITYKKIPFFLIITGVLSGVIFGVRDGISGLEMLYAFLPGVLLMAAAFATGEKVGYGDGLLVLVLGLLEGGKLCFADVLTGLLLAALVGVFLLIFRKSGKNREIPFIPFLMISHILSMVVGG